MALFYFLNAVASIIACSGLTFAVFSKHVCDGVFIKKCLSASAIGFAANAVYPSFNSIVWISCSLAAMFVFVGIRCAQAYRKHQKPTFIV